MGDPKKKSADPLAKGQRRVHVSYSPDGFRGVRDYDADYAEALVQDRRAKYVADDTPLGEDEPPAGEFRGPLNASADTSSNGAEGSATAGSTASTASSGTSASASAR